jgi:hypothetical protein
MGLGYENSNLHITYEVERRKKEGKEEMRKEEKKKGRIMGILTCI